MLAAQVARRLTGRKLILMARYGYHGSYEDLEVGLVGQDGERTMLADFGEATAFEALLSERGSEIAAVFLEPVLGSAGIVEPPAGFLGRVAEAAHRAGMKVLALCHMLPASDLAAAEVVRASISYLDLDDVIHALRGR